jgi:hypothetical protein
MALFLNPISSTNAEVFSMLDCRSRSLACGGILGWPFVMAYVTAPRIVVEMPSAVIGVEDRIVCESAASSMPVAVMVVARVGYLCAMMLT